MFRIRSLVRKRCHLPLLKGSSDRLLLRVPKPGNPLRLKARSSVAYPRNSLRQTQLTYLPYFQSLKTRKMAVFQPRACFDSLLPSGAVVAGAVAGSTGESWQMKGFICQDSGAELSPRTELECHLKSVGCLETSGAGSGAKLIRYQKRGDSRGRSIT